MKQTTNILVVTALVLCGLSTHVAADGVSTLENNPFARPDSTVGGSDFDAVPTSTDAREFDLRATLVAGKSGVANIGGKIVKPGEQVGGWRLLRVYEDRALFARNEQRVVVYVKPEREEDNE